MYRTSWPAKGYTLTELVLALAISALVGSGLLSVYYCCSQIYAQQAAYTDAQYSARSSLQQISTDIRSASRIEILAASTQLRLGMAGGEVITYYVRDRQLYRESVNEYGTVTIPIAENISILNFYGISSMVTIDLEADVDGKKIRLSSSVNSRLAYFDI